MLTVFFYFQISAAESLKKGAPKGVDCFFDNVGGNDSTVVMMNMNARGRIAICGAISTYNDEKPTMAVSVQGPMVFKELRMEGFLVHRWVNRLD